MTDRSQFYTGFVAECYDVLVPEDEAGTYAIYRRAIESHGGAALELGCGTGRPLLSFVESGLDVEGLDASQDMLARCRRKAEAAGLDVRLHHQRMESFEVSRRFRTLFVVSSSFMLLPDDDAVRSSLAACHEHLEPGGQLLLALHVSQDPGPAQDESLHVTREATRADGATLRCLGRVLRFDPEAQQHEMRLRYQLLRGDEVEHEEDHDFLLHWHTQEQFAGHLREAGFVSASALDYAGAPARPDAQFFLFRAERPGG